MSGIDRKRGEDEAWKLYQCFSSVQSLSRVRLFVTPWIGRDWGQEKKGMTEDEMAGWHYGLYGRESE